MESLKQPETANYQTKEKITLILDNIEAVAIA